MAVEVVTSAVVATKYYYIGCGGIGIIVWVVEEVVMVSILLTVKVCSSSTKCSF